MADNDQLITCPACGCEMEKIFMPSQGVHLDVCTKGCGGIYFDNREFQKFDEPHEDITPLLNVLQGKEFKQVDENDIRMCPVCGSRMMKNFSSAKQEVQVDECYNCGGKFLDFGELDKIRAEYNTEKERVQDVMLNLYKDVGAEVLIRKPIEKRRSSYFIRGLVFGVLIAVMYVLFNQKYIFSGSPEPEIIKQISMVTFGIILVFGVLGFLFGKSDK